jgi:beta-glucosidase
MAFAAALTLGVASASSAHVAPSVSKSTCAAKPWTQASYQASSSPSALASLVISCLQLEYPKSYLHDEVGIVALNSYPWFQNINEFGNGSSVQDQLASLGIPPLSLQDGPGGIITHASPSPTPMPDDLALGATFDTSMATLYGSVLGGQAHAMGYDSLQAPNLNLLRVPTWGRAFESFGEAPVLAGEMGAAEAVAIAEQHVIPVLKHFGPYSQDTDRRALNQIVSEKALEELYVRPFTIALRALLPLLHEGNHAVGIMCSYGNVNSLKACRSPLLAQELNYVGVNALVRSDLDVEVNPSALVLNGVDLIKPMDTGELVAALSSQGVDAALRASATQVIETEFEAGLVNGKSLSAVPHRLSSTMSGQGALNANLIEQRAAVLLKNDGVLPLSTSSGPKIAVISDGELPATCQDLAGTLTRALRVSATCTDAAKVSLPETKLFPGLLVNRSGVTRHDSFTAPVKGPYVVVVTTLGNTSLSMGGTNLVNTQGLAEFNVQRTALVQMNAGQKYNFTLTYHGAVPSVVIIRYQNEVHEAVAAAKGAKLAIFLAYDLSREGMDRSSLQLPYAQNAIIPAIAAQVPTVVVVGSDGAVTMPWLSAVNAVLEVWNPTGSIQQDSIFARYVTAWTNLLDGSADPSGRLPVTFPVSTNQSPAGVSSFWPGNGTNANLNDAPDQGVGIGMTWYRAAGWPVLFPFGYGLSYTTFQTLGGSLQSSSSGLSMAVTVRDDGNYAGAEPIQVYADWPNSAGEPQQQLVGFGTAVFTKSQANSLGTDRVTIPLSPDAFTALVGSTNRLVSGSYCLEAATYDGDPHAWSTGSVTLTSNGKQLSVAGTDNLTQSTCPG